MNRYTIIIAIAAALTVAWAAQMPASRKQEWIVSSTPMMRGHDTAHPFEVECLPADDEFAAPRYVYVNPYHQLTEGDDCPAGQPSPAPRP